jgi:hypothetical protein
LTRRFFRAARRLTRLIDLPVREIDVGCCFNVSDYLEVFSLLPRDPLNDQSFHNSPGTTAKIHPENEDFFYCRVDKNGTFDFVYLFCFAPSTIT